MSDESRAWLRAYCLELALARRARDLERKLERVLGREKKLKEKLKRVQSLGSELKRELEKVKNAL